MRSFFSSKSKKNSSSSSSTSAKKSNKKPSTQPIDNPKSLSTAKSVPSTKKKAINNSATPPNHSPSENVSSSNVKITKKASTPRQSLSVEIPQSSSRRSSVHPHSVSSLHPDVSKRYSASTPSIHDTLHKVPSPISTTHTHSRDIHTEKFISNENIHSDLNTKKNDTTSNHNKPKDSKSHSGSIVVTLTSENYDSTLFKIGWLNKSQGEVLSNEHSMSLSNLGTAKDNGNLNNNSISPTSSSFQRQNSDPNSGSNKRDSIFFFSNNSNQDLTSDPLSNLNPSQPMVPDYKLYKAQLRGPTLSLYRNGLNTSVKYFVPPTPHTINIPSDSTYSFQNEPPLSSPTNKSIHSSRREFSNSSISSYHNNNNNLTPLSPTATKSKRIKPVELSYLECKYPHPDLVLDKDLHKIIDGSIESYCHTVLFAPDDTHNHDKQSETSHSKRPTTIRNLILILPLLDHFENFLNIFLQMTLTFTKHNNKLSNKSTQFCHISIELDDQLVTRLDILLNSVIEHFPSFLLDEHCLRQLHSLLEAMELHNDKHISALKSKLHNKHLSITTLNAYTNNPSKPVNKNILDVIFNTNKFLKLDIAKFTDEIHQINMKFDKYWSPKSDYSLLYDSKLVDRTIHDLNPLVFNNNRNIHFLGRLLVNHLFPKSKIKPITPKMRAKLLNKWIQIGCHFEHLGDMVSWLAIATIICSIPVLRLASSWNHIPESSLKIIYDDWTPTISQLNRRAFSSSPINSVFILAPPYLDDAKIRENTISYFGDLLIHADQLDKSNKFRSLEKKINRTKNAFQKWKDRLSQYPALESKNSSSHDDSNVINDPNLSPIYELWKFHLQEPAMNIHDIMKLSIQFEPPLVDQNLYSNIGSHSSSLLNGNYLPVLFNELLPSYSIFSQDSLIGAAGHYNNGISSKMLTNQSYVNGNQSETFQVPPRSSARIPKTALGNDSSIPPDSEDPTVLKSSRTDSNLISSSESINSSLTSTVMVSASASVDDLNNSYLTGVDKIDDPVLKEMATVHSNKQRLMKTIRDAFNIDMDLFHVYDNLIFKSVYEKDELKSKPNSVVIETPTRFSSLSSFRNSFNRDSQGGGLFRFSKNIEHLDLFKTVGTMTDSITETSVNVVLKSGSLNKIFDLLVFNTNIFSKLVNTKDLEKFYYHQRIRKKYVNADNDNIGLLDYGFVQLVMECNVFSETLFNTYKSFTTTKTVLNELAQRFFKAPNCSISLGTLFNSDSNDIYAPLLDDSFPDWNSPIIDDKRINYKYTIMIQVGVVNAFTTLVQKHYSDFTDDLDCNEIFLESLREMENDVLHKWPEYMGKLDSTANVSEIESLVKGLSDKLSTLKELYHSKVFYPIGPSNSQSLLEEISNNAGNVAMIEYSKYINDGHIKDEMAIQFNKLNFKAYQDILEWIYKLDSTIATSFNIVSDNEWFSLYSELELFSTESLISMFSSPYRSESMDIINGSNSHNKSLPISNIFSWISTVTSKKHNKDMKLFESLPRSIRHLLRLHISLTTFFTISVCDISKTHKERVETCTLLLQLLNYVRWKNSSLELFQESSSNSRQIISPHIPSFIETSICNAIVSVESRYHERTWIEAYNNLTASDDSTELQTIYDLLDYYDDTHIRNFVSYDGYSIEKTNLSPCPGWFMSRLLEISLFVPNMATTNTKLINFDKRRFTNNLIFNILDLVPHQEHSTNSKKDEKVSHSKSFGNSLSLVFDDPNDKFKLETKRIADAEGALSKVKRRHIFEGMLLKEVDKLKREQNKLDILLAQEPDNSKAVALEKLNKRRNRNSVIIPNFQLPNESSGIFSSAASHSTSQLNAARGKRTSTYNPSSRAPAASPPKHTGVHKKIGGILRRPFSIGGFSNSNASSPIDTNVLDDDIDSISSLALPGININELNEQKPSVVIKTFEIKSLLPVSNYKNSLSYSYAFKIILQNGNEHILQAVSSKDVEEWLRLIKASKRYSFYSKKYKGITQNKIFGVPIEDLCERENSSIPMIVTKLLNEIELRGLDEVGLYRIPGSVGSINALKNAFDEEGAVNNTFTLEDDRWFEINAIAGCFKMYLRELPDSLFTNERLPKLVDIAIKKRAGQLSYDDYRMDIVKLLENLPDCYYETLKRIMFHLNKVHRHVTNNRMDASNLAIVFSMSFINQDDLTGTMGPNLGSVQSILQDFIKTPDDFFLN